jgi:chromosome segregation ATPase
MKMTRLLPLAAVAGIVAPLLHAAPAAPTTAQWEAALAAREQRADLLHDEITAIDARIESRIDVIVEALRTIGDSKDSRTKVARMKEQTMESLKKSIAYYQSKRAALQEEMRRPTLRLTEEQKKKGIAAFDAHIEKRVAQILAVQKSLPAHQDYERYKATGTTWEGGTTYAANEDFRQNQRVTSHTNTQRKKIEAELSASISRLEQQTRNLKAQGAPAAEIAKNEALLSERRQQRASALSPSAEVTRSVGGKEAQDLDKALQTAIADLRKDFTTLFARYSAYLQELSAVNQTRDGLTALKTKNP